MERPSTSGLRALIAALLCVPALFATAGLAHASVQYTYYVTTAGTANSTCSQSEPCTMAAAQALVESNAPSATGDIDVVIAGGTYTLSAPLSFTTADSGENGHQVVWEAAAGQTPVFTGAQVVSGWTQVGTTGIWMAPAPSGVTATRQVYVNGISAQVARSDYTSGGALPTGWATTTPDPNTGIYSGYTVNPSATGFDPQYNVPAWPDAVGAEINYFGPSYIAIDCPVGSVSGETITMATPCFGNANPGSGRNFVSGTFSYVQNAYELLHRGQWYLDQTGAEAATTGAPAGQAELYYMPTSTQQMTGAGAVSVTVPGVNQLLSVTGTESGDLTTSSGTVTRVHNITFTGLTFEDSTWALPDTTLSGGVLSSDGFVDQQSNMSLTGTSLWCGATSLVQTPAAVDIAYADDITFDNNTIADVGDAGLNVEKSSNNITVKGNVIENTAANGLQIGGMTLADQRPYDRTDNAVYDITVQDNYIHDVASEFIDGDGIWAGYVNGVNISHNEVADVPYTGISVGWGWGGADQGGTGPCTSYNPQTGATTSGPAYTTATVSGDNTVDDNYIHDFMFEGTDGGGIYTNGDQRNVLGQTTNSGSGNSQIEGNWIADSPSGNPMIGIYDDNGTQGFTETQNVVDNVDSSLYFTTAGGQLGAANNSRSGDWFNTSTYASNCSANTCGTGEGGSAPPNVTGDEWPSGAVAVMDAAGLQPAYQSLHGSASTTNLARDAIATTSNTANASVYGAPAAVDDDGLTRWATTGNTTAATLTLEFPQAMQIDRTVLQEGRWGGTHIEAYTIDYSNDGSTWTTAATDNYPGFFQNDVFSPVTAKYLRLNITKSIGGPSVVDFLVYDDNPPAPSWSSWAGGGSTAGAAASSPAVAYDSAKNTYTAVAAGVVNSSQLYESTWTSASGWSTWTAAGPTIAFTGTPAVASYNGRTDIFVEGSDGLIHQTTQATPGGSWSTWASLGGPTGGFASSPAVAYDSAKNTYTVVATSASNTSQIYESIWSSSGGWAAWATAGPTAGFAGTPAVTAYNGRTDLWIVGVSYDNVAYQSTQATPGGTWTAWTYLGGPAGGLTNNYAAAYDPVNNTYTVLAPSTSNTSQLYATSWTSAHGWSAWATAGPTTGFTATPAMTSYNGATDVFVEGTDGLIRQTAQTTLGGSWSAWASLGAPPGIGSLASSPAAAYDPVTNSYTAVAAGTANSSQLYESAWTVPSGWSTWAAAGPTIAFTGTPAVTSYNGRTDIFVEGTDGLIHQTTQATPGGSWSAWASLGAPTGGFASSPAAAFDPVNDTYTVVATSASNTSQLYESIWTSSGGWSTWATAGPTGGFAGTPAVTSYNGRTDLWIVGVSYDNVAYQSTQATPGGTWTAWTYLGGPAGGLTNNYAAAYDPAENTYTILAPSASNTSQLYATTWTSSSGWSAWTAAGPATGFTATPAMTSYDGRTDIFIEGTDNLIHQSDLITGS